jgi:hypothetical protein
MATFARPLATCVLRWIYEQAAAILQMLKQALLALLAYIDTAIAAARAWLTQWDLLAKAEEIAWALVQAAVEAIKDALTSFPEGPLAEFCPEFYAYFLDPAIGLLDANTAALSAIRNKYKNYLSAVFYFEQIIAYWTQIKADLVSAIDVLDDAIHHALLVEAAEAVP